MTKIPSKFHYPDRTGTAHAVILDPALKNRLAQVQFTVAKPPCHLHAEHRELFTRNFGVRDEVLNITECASFPADANRKTILQSCGYARSSIAIHSGIMITYRDARSRNLGTSILNAHPRYEDDGNAILQEFPENTTPFIAQHPSSLQYINDLELPYPHLYASNPIIVMIGASYGYLANQVVDNLRISPAIRHRYLHQALHNMELWWDGREMAAPHIFLHGQEGQGDYVATEAMQVISDALRSRGCEVIHIHLAKKGPDPTAWAPDHAWDIESFQLPRLHEIMHRFSPAFDPSMMPDGQLPAI